MKVIKVIKKSYSSEKLVSTFAPLEWQKEYKQGVETKPDTGLLFAYSKRNMKEAKRNFGSDKIHQYWLAEAEVVGKVQDGDIFVREESWSCFWKGFKPRLRYKGADYLLCSSITLIKELE